MSRQGRHGESQFATLCQDPRAKTDAVVNPSKDDMHGWDHIVDLTPPNDVLLSADIADHLIQCFVQVKTTRTRTPTAVVKVSNAVKAAKSPNPFFVFLFHHDGSGKEAILYGKHIGYGEIERIMKRARKLSHSGDDVQLHKSTISFSFSKNDQLSEFPSDWMMSKIFSFGGVGTYPTRKLDFVNSVGYEEGAHEGSFSFPTSVPTRDIALHEIGLVEDLPVTDFTIHEKRFGITSRNPVTFIQDGRISFTREGSPVRVFLTSKEGKTLPFVGELKAPKMIPYGHEEYLYRIDAGCIELLISPAKEEITYNFNFGFNDQELMCQRVSLACLYAWQDSDDLQMDIFTNIGRLLKTTIDRLDADEKPWLPKYATVGEHLLEVLGEDRFVSLRCNASQLHDVTVDLYLASVVSTAGAFHVEFDIEGEIEEFSHLLAYSCSSMGKLSFGAIYELEYGARTQVGTRQKLYFCRPRIIRKYCLQQAQSKFKKFLEREFAECRQDYKSPTAVLMDGDFKKLNSDLGNNGILHLDVS